MIASSRWPSLALAALGATFSFAADPAASEALSAKRDGILAFHRLNVPATLNVTFLSTNHIENVIRNTRGMIGRVCRWQAHNDQLERWMGVALLRAQSGFRRVRGRRELGALPSLNRLFLRKNIFRCGEHCTEPGGVSMGWVSTTGIFARRP